MIEIARTQDEEVGDGTTSVIVLAGEMLSVAEEFFEQKLHPTVVIAAYLRAMDDIIHILEEKIAVPIDITDREQMLKIVKSCIGTKLVKQWEGLACQIALDAVSTVAGAMFYLS
jgi:T-complex protein 1 subunit gamma